MFVLGTSLIVQDLLHLAHDQSQPRRGNHEYNIALVLFENEFLNIVAISFTALILNELIMVALEITKWYVSFLPNPGILNNKQSSFFAGMSK